MKKSILKLIPAAAILLFLAGCSGWTNEQQDGARRNPYYPENEITTVEDLNDDRMVIVIDMQFNVSTANIGEVVEAKFPEVNVLLHLQNMVDTTYYTKKSLEHGLLGDIFFCAVGMTKDEEVISEHFIDLSDAPFINNYYQNALDGVADSTSIGAFMDGVAVTIAKGNIFSEVRYTDLAFNNAFQVAFREAMIGYLDGSMEMEAAMAYCDEAMRTLRNAVEQEEEVYGAAAQNFTVLETAEFVADILREEAEADLALVLAGQPSYGEPGNFYEGDITDTALNFVTMDYVSGKNPAYNRLVTVDLTGEQIFSILNDPYLNNTPSNTRTKWLKYDNPTYWVPSNLKIEYAPLLPENSIRSIKNMDGSEFDLEKTYRVAIWNGCFSNLAESGYFDAATLAAMGAVTPASEKSSVELIKAAVIEAGVITPPDDGRFTIRWDITPRTTAEK